jgi:iron complex transport system ATP-binding protein
MRRGSVLASGRLERVFTEENLSKCFGVPLAIEHRKSRWSARTLL